MASARKSKIENQKFLSYAAELANHCTALSAVFPVRDYDLAATLSSGQAFRWRFQDKRWVGIIDSRWVALRPEQNQLLAEVAEPVRDWTWLTDYLQLHVNLDQLLQTFPDDPPLKQAVSACHGLRLLRQDSWECLASFILSSTKQIIQIQQVIGNLCACFGEPVKVPERHPPAFAFPTPASLAAASEPELRACKMGFRAKYLLPVAQRVANGQFELESLSGKSLEDARATLLELPGVGRKIADCVLLFAYGFAEAFPVDVWIMRGLRELYFQRRRPTLKKLMRFAETHFGPNAGYAQQYLFHYMRTRRDSEESSIRSRNTRIHEP